MAVRTFTLGVCTPRSHVSCKHPGSRSPLSFYPPRRQADSIQAQLNACAHFAHTTSQRLTRDEVGARLPLNRHTTAQAAAGNRSTGLCALTLCRITPYPQGNQREPSRSHTQTSRAHTASHRRRFITLHSGILNCRGTHAATADVVAETCRQQCHISRRVT